MSQDHYTQPKSCQANGIYYLKISASNGKAEYKKVRFLGYRPHPAEVLVHDGRKPRVVHRRFLYTKISANGGCSQERPPQ